MSQMSKRFKIIFQIMSQIIRKIIDNNADLTDLYVIINSIYDYGKIYHNYGIIDLLQALEKNTVVRELTLSYLRLDDESVRALASLVAVNKSVVKIDFNLIEGNLTEDACNILATKLQHNNCLQSVGIINPPSNILSCDVNNFIAAICNGLCKNRSLQKLSFVGTNIVLECAKSRAFIRLYFSNWDENMINYVNVLATSFVQIFKSNPYLRSITLELPVGSYSVALPKILEAIKYNKSLVDFKLYEHNSSHGSYNDYNDKIATAITDILLTNKSVEKICLGQSVRLSYKGWLKVSEALRTNLPINHLRAGIITYGDSLAELSLSDLKNENKINAKRKENLNFCWRIFYENIGGHVELKLKRFFNNHGFVNAQQLEDILLFYSLRDEQRCSEQYKELRVKVVENILNNKESGPLSMSIKLGRLDICKALVNMGAQLSQDALILAKEYYRTNIVEWLNQYDLTKSVVFSKKPNALPAEVMQKIGSFLKNGHELRF
jgi:hypothetical protein